MNAITSKAITKSTESTRNWYDDLLRFARKWIKGKQKFTAEDVRAAWERKHDYRPAEWRVIGAVIRQLHDERLIRFVSYGKAKNPSSHQKPLANWKSKI